LTTVDTQISWGYLPLLEIFAKANSLVLKFEPWHSEEEVEGSSIIRAREFTRISYEENSDTAISITCLSIKHLGFENMLCDYLIRCNVQPQMIPIGKAVMRKDPEQMEKEWQEHRKKIGLAR
jgi:hypothetical protein